MGAAEYTKGVPKEGALNRTSYRDRNGVERSSRVEITSLKWHRSFTILE